MRYSRTEYFVTILTKYPKQASEKGLKHFTGKRTQSHLHLSYLRREEEQQGKHHSLHQSSLRTSQGGREKSSKPTLIPAAGTLGSKSHTPGWEPSECTLYSRFALRNQGTEPCPFPSTLAGPVSRNIHKGSPGEFPATHRSLNQQKPHPALQILQMKGAARRKALQGKLQVFVLLLLLNDTGKAQMAPPKYQTLHLPQLPKCGQTARHCQHTER